MSREALLAEFQEQRREGANFLVPIKGILAPNQTPQCRLKVAIQIVLLDLLAAIYHQHIKSG